MRRPSETIDDEIQALTREFMEDLTQLVRQHTLELVLAQLEGGWYRRTRTSKEPVTVSLYPG